MWMKYPYLTQIDVQIRQFSFFSLPVRSTNCSYRQIFKRMQGHNNLLIFLNAANNALYNAFALQPTNWLVLTQIFSSSHMVPYNGTLEAVSRHVFDKNYSVTNFDLNIMR